MPPPTWRGALGLIAAAATVLIAIAWSAALGLAEREQKADLEVAERQVSNLALALDRHANFLLRVADRITLRVKEAAELQDMARVRSQLAHVRDRYETQLAFAALIGSDGNVLVGSGTGSGGLNVADRDHFKVHVRSDSGLPYIGGRIEGRLTKKGAVTLSRRVNGPGGTFAGVAAAALDLDALDGFLREFAIGLEGSIHLLRLDGTVIVRRSASSTRDGRHAAPAFIPPTPAINAPVNGTLLNVAPLDGSQRITSYRRLREYPLIVAVTESKREVLAATQRTQAGIYGAAAFFTVLVLAGALLACRFAVREQRNAAALRASEERFRTIFEQAPLGITVSDYERRYIHANDAFCRMLGRTRDEVIGHSGEEFLLPEDFHRSRAIRDRFFRGEISAYSLELRYRRPDGGVVWTKRTSAPIHDADGRVHHVLHTVEDITERREMDALLRLHVEATQAVAAAASFESGIGAVARLMSREAGWEIAEAWVPAPDGSRLVWLESAFCSTIEDSGRFREESRNITHLKGERLTGRVWATGKAEWRRIGEAPDVPRRARLVGKTLQVHCCIPVMMGNEVAAVLSYHTRRARPEDPRLLEAAISITAQLSELFQRKRIEDEVRLHSQILENLAEGVHLVRSRDGIIVFANSALETMFGYEQGGLLGRRGSVLHAAGDRAFDEASGSVAAAVRESGRWNGTVRNVRKDGGTLWCSVRVSRFEHPRHGDVWISLHEDITDRKRAEQELQRSAALSRLLEALARAVNEATTPTAAIQSCLEHICDYGAWQLAHFVLMPGSELGNPYTSYWHPPRGAERYADVMRESDNVLGARSDPAGKFAARAIRERRPVWIADLASVQGLSRLQNLVRAGMRSAFGFPVFAGEKAVAFVEFFAADAREADEALMAAGNSIAAQLARLIERDRAFRANAELAAIVKTATVAIFTRTFDGKILSWNPGAERMLGYTAEEAVGRDVFFTLPPGRPARLAHNNEILLRGEMVTHESDRLTRDGRVIDVLMSHSPIRDSTGTLIGASVILQDISALKRAQAIVRESEERFRAAFEEASVGMSLRRIEEGGEWLRVNRKLCDLLGYTREELLPHPPDQIHPPEERALAAGYSRQLLHGEITHYSRERRYRRKDGQFIWGRIAVSALRGADGKPSERFAIVEDITEQKRAEQALRESEQRLRAFLSNSAVIAWMKDEDGQYLFLSDNYQRRLQPWIEDWKGRTDFDLWPREIAEELRRNDLAVLAGGRAIEVVEQTLNPDDHESWWLTNKFVFQDTTGRRYVGGLGVDVTERKRLEAERQRLAAIVSSSNDAILSQARDRTILSWNAAAEGLFGWSAQEALGRSALFVVPPEHVDDLVALGDRVWAGERVEPVEISYRRRDGTPFPTQVTLSPIRDEYNQIGAISVMIRDITERKAAETALRDYSTRLQTLSRRLIDAQERERAVIARELHDQTGQVLSVLKLTLQIARRDARARQVAPHLDEALQHIDTALQQVRTLSYSLRPPQLDDLGLVAALRNFADRIGGAAGLALHYDIQAPPRLSGQAAIACFRVAQEAITNVVRHAAAKNLWIGLACDDELRLEVRDDGKGCDMIEVRRRALRGDSMGVVNMEERTLLGGGRIDLASSPGSGTVVRANFPFCIEEPAPAAEHTT